MKKLIALLLVAVMALSLAACGEEEKTTPTTTEAAPVAAPAPLDVLTAAWNGLAEENKFFAMGGDFNAPVDNAPGTVTDKDYITGSLLVPEAEQANIAEISNLVHAMNANTFTCGAYKLADGADASAFVTAMQTAIKGNQWMCGFPETLLIASVDGTIVVIFGHGDAVTPFKTALTTAYPTTQILVEEPLA